MQKSYITFDGKPLCSYSILEHEDLFPLWKDRLLPGCACHKTPEDGQKELEKIPQPLRARFAVVIGHCPQYMALKKPLT